MTWNQLLNQLAFGWFPYFAVTVLIVVGVLAAVQGLTALAADMGLYDVDIDARLARVKAEKTKSL